MTVDGEALRRFRALALTQRLDLATYRQIMSSPTWGYLTQAVRVTRAYESGLDGGLFLLRFTEEHAGRLRRRERETNLRQLYWLILDMLDKLDRWDEYLATWKAIRDNTRLTLRYASDARCWHGSRFEPFILREAPGVLDTHFLWLCAHRKELIERKLVRKRTGRSVEHLKHAPQETLSEAEIEQRLASVVAKARRASQAGEGR